MRQSLGKKLASGTTATSLRQCLGKKLAFFPECYRAKISHVCNFCAQRHITLVLSVKFYKVRPVLCKIRSVHTKMRPFPGQRNVTLVLKAKISTLNCNLLDRKRGYNKNSRTIRYAVYV